VLKRGLVGKYRRFTAGFIDLTHRCLSIPYRGKTRKRFTA
jgi:hypothetical protein